MTRALSTTWRCLATWMSALFLIALTSSTALAGKPTVAILGLEVVDSSGQIDQVSTQIAKDLTEGLRTRAKAGTGPYQLVAGGDKELIDEKLIHNCDTEAIACMAEIGKNLGADFLIYGNLVKKADGFVVTINLLNVGKRKFERAKTPLVITQKDPNALAAASKKAYNDLTGVSEMGTLVITANAERGTVIIDDEPKGTLASGTVSIPLKESRYRLVIEADGYKRSQEVTVTIRSGETTTQPVTLEATSGGARTDEIKHEITGTTSSEKTNMWKPVFYVSAAATVGLAVYSGFAFMKQGSAVDDANASMNKPAGMGTFGPDDCGSSDPAVKAFLEDTCKWNKQHRYTAYAAIGVGAIMLTSGVFAFFRGSSERPATTTSSTTGRRTPKKQFSLTPIVSADGGGATFQIDW